MTLLTGSDPHRAPGGLNQWTYLQEETDGERAAVFALRTNDDGSMAMPGEDGPTLSISCDLLNTSGVTTKSTTLPARGLTYRMLPQVFDRLPAPSSWRLQKQTSSLNGARQGFLSALRVALGREHDGRNPGTEPPTPYVHNNTFYELAVSGRRELGRKMVGPNTYEQLRRAEFCIRTQGTHVVTKFAATYVSRGEVAPAPIQIIFYPRFWLSVELRRDEAAEAPREPTSDVWTLERVHRLCGSVGESEQSGSF
jgi:hypothetical protein